MIGNILDNTTELWMTKYIIGEIFNSGGATLYKNPSDQTVKECDQAKCNVIGQWPMNSIIAFKLKLTYITLAL